MTRQTKLTDKDLSAIREADDAATQFRQTRGALRDFSGNHKVVMVWDFNDEAKRDLIFKLIIDDEIELFLDWEQMARYGRWI